MMFGGLFQENGWKNHYISAQRNLMVPDKHLTSAALLQLDVVGTSILQSKSLCSVPVQSTL